MEAIVTEFFALSSFADQWNYPGDADLGSFFQEPFEACCIFYKRNGDGDVGLRFGLKIEGDNFYLAFLPVIFLYNGPCHFAFAVCEKQLLSFLHAEHLHYVLRCVLIENDGIGADVGNVKNGKLHAAKLRLPVLNHVRPESAGRARPWSLSGHHDLQGILSRVALPLSMVVLQGFVCIRRS